MSAQVVARPDTARVRLQPVRSEPAFSRRGLGPHGGHGTPGAGQLPVDPLDKPVVAGEADAVVHAVVRTPGQQLFAGLVLVSPESARMRTWSPSHRCRSRSMMRPSGRSRVGRDRRCSASTGRRGDGRRRRCRAAGSSSRSGRSSRRPHSDKLDVRSCVGGILVRYCRMSGLLLGRSAATAWRADALRGLQGRDPPKANPRTLGQEGGEETSVGFDLGEAVITGDDCTWTLSRTRRRRSPIPIVHSNHPEEEDQAGCNSATTSSSCCRNSSRPSRTIRLSAPGSDSSKEVAYRGSA